MNGHLTHQEVAVEAFDLKQMQDRWSLDSTFAGKLVEKFCDKAADELDQLRSCIDRGQWDETVRLAHGLQGAAEYVYASRFQQIAAQLETLARDHDDQQVQRALDQLLAEQKQCAQAAKQFPQIQPA
jgi:HPt (histidine-containing phosphotransfer) domain-containing protein